MKMMVKLAILFAALLLVTGVSFALPPPPCPYASCYAENCYNVTGTNLDNPINSFTGQDWLVCWDAGSPAPSQFVCVNGNLSWNLSQFTEGLNWQTILYDGIGGGGYMTFHGSASGIGAFNGILFNGITRYKIHGVEEPCAFALPD